MKEVQYNIIEVPAGGLGKPTYKIIRTTKTWVEVKTDWTVARDLTYFAATKIVQEFRSLQGEEEHDEGLAG